MSIFQALVRGIGNNSVEDVFSPILFIDRTSTLFSPPKSLNMQRKTKCQKPIVFGRSKKSEKSDRSSVKASRQTIAFFKLIIGVFGGYRMEINVLRLSCEKMHFQ